MTRMCLVRGGRRWCTVGSVLGLIVAVGCVASPRGGGPEGLSAEKNAVTSRPTAKSDYLTGQAGSMAADDARRTKPAIDTGQRTRPDPIRRETRPPVDQPRFR
jgi:hypothetical protein